MRRYGENLSGILAKETTQKISVEAFTSTEIFVIERCSLIYHPKAHIQHHR